METLNKNGVSITQTQGEEKYVWERSGGRFIISMIIAILTAICFQLWLKRLKNVVDSGMNG